MTQSAQLKEYFKLSKEHFQIGNCELMQDRPYAEKVNRLNEIFIKLRQLEKTIKL